MDFMNDALKEFLLESNEGLDRLESELVELEERPKDEELLGRIFRTIHSIKGSSSFFAFHRLETVAHAGEDLLSELRDGMVDFDQRLATALLAAVDAIREMLAAIESSNKDGDKDYRDVIAGLKALLSNAQVASDKLPKQIRQRETKEQAVTEQAANAAEEEQVSAQKSAEPRNGHALADSALRVDVKLLDKLMNLVGELVLARNQIMQHMLSQRDSAAFSASQRLNLITTELQAGVMKTRMQPIGTLWNKYPRLVRDLALECGREVRIEMEGEETELDKTILEAVRDPLTHLLRNAVDHGIESPEKRRAAGKTAEGRIHLRALHESGQVIIEISDDGEGIDLDSLKQKALNAGLISSAQAVAMSDRELTNLIFMPGLSTAASVTNVSGRGVGMDVVRTNVERIGGTVDVHSELGRGTTVRMKIPLTLAIIPALIVTCGGDRYAIPQINLLELVHHDSATAGAAIETIQGAAVYRLRGRLLPLLFLRRVLGGEFELKATNSVTIVILQADSKQFGLVVDGIQDTEEIVVKPLGKQLKGVSQYAGAAILGDGKVALILDALGMAHKSGLVLEGEKWNAGATTPVTAEKAKQRLLVVELAAKQRLGIFLGLVARLEEFPKEKVERVGNREVVQYRGQIMPLIRLNRIFEMPEVESADQMLQVIVYTERQNSIGFVVDQIIDVIEDEILIDAAMRQQGTLGSAIVHNRVTDLLDVQGIIQQFHPAFNTEITAERVN